MGGPILDKKLEETNTLLSFKTIPNNGQRDASIYV
jgi:hypothetical protein